MKKLLTAIFCMTVIFCVYGVNASAASVKSSDYLPSTQKSQYKEGTGYYLDNYRFKYKTVFKKGYWHTYEYDFKKKKYNSYVSSKLKYVVKKDGIHTIDYQNNYGEIDRMESKVLPATLKKGMKFTTYAKLKGYPTAKYNNVVASINVNMTIKGKKYKNVVKIVQANKKEKLVQYWAKGKGIIKHTYTNGENGVSKMRSTSYLIK